MNEKIMEAEGRGQESCGTDDSRLFSFVEYNPAGAEKIGISEYSYWGSVWNCFLKRKDAVIMSLIFILLFLFTFLAGPLGKYKYDELVPAQELAFTLPGREFWFGTDNLGRDYWCQVWYAAKTSILLAFIVAAGEAVVGVTIGCIWGYVRKLDRFFTELYNLISNIPTIIYMTLIALIIGQSFAVMCVTLICFGWLQMARNVRNLVFMYRDREYNLASRCLGTKLGKILTVNILPYLLSVIIMRLAMSIPQTIALETTLSYLGLGLGVNTPSLGILLRNARNFFLAFPHLLIFPSVIVGLITITFYLAGNAFSDACDPKNHV